MSDDKEGKFCGWRVDRYRVCGSLTARLGWEFGF
jgi:hypothetical protein